MRWPKTVLRSLLSKWGILSIEMQKGTISDETVIKDVTKDGNIISETELEDTPTERIDVTPVEENPVVNETASTETVDETDDDLPF